MKGGDQTFKSLSSGVVSIALNAPNGCILSVCATWVPAHLHWERLLHSTDDDSPQALIVMKSRKTNECG